MSIHTPEQIELPTDFDLDGVESKEALVKLEAWLADLNRALEEYVKLLFFDVSQIVKSIVRTSISVDLSGASATLVCLHTERDVTIEKATLLYIEASSGDAGSGVEIGKETDRNYFFDGTSEVSKAQWYSKDVTLLKTNLLAGDTLTLYSAGGKTGTGEVMLVIEYSFD